MMRASALSVFAASITALAVHAQQPAPPATRPENPTTPGRATAPAEILGKSAKAGTATPAATPLQPKPDQPQPGQPKVAQPAASTTSVNPAAHGTPAAAVREANPIQLDGNWTVVSLEKDGHPVAGAKNLTVSVRNGVATFAGGNDHNRQKAMRLEFGERGMIRVTETEDAKATETAPASVNATTAPAGRVPSAVPGTLLPTGSTTAAQPAQSANAKTGHYILTGEYFAVCLMDAPAATAGQPAGAVGSFQPVVPKEKSSCTVILKRDAQSGTRGTPSASR